MSRQTGPQSPRQLARRRRQRQVFTHRINVCASLSVRRWTNSRPNGRRRDLALGRGLGAAGPILLLLVPATVIGVLAMRLATTPQGWAMSWARLAAMVLGYLVYFTIFVGVSLMVSARSHSANGACHATRLLVHQLPRRAARDGGRGAAHCARADDFGVPAADRRG
jgi:hypothetical protein